MKNEIAHCGLCAVEYYGHDPLRSRGYVSAASQDAGIVAARRHLDGVGWVEHEGFPRREFTVAMEVQSKLGGLVLTQELLERELFGDVVFHHSFGIMTYDAKVGRHSMATIMEDGTIRVVELKLVDGGVEWTYDDPELGRVRNELTVTEARMLYASGSVWQEGNWKQFY